jgi:diguanylate cyclase (GGDEF)-like protein
MALTPHLDQFTLLVCGNALLLAMALTLAAVSAHRGEAARALHIWTASLLLFVVSGALFLAELRLTLPDWFPPPKAGVAGSLIAFTVMQQLAVQQLSRGGVTWAMVVKCCLPTLMLVTALASMLPSLEARGALMAIGRVAIPLFAIWRLWPLLRGSRGARILLAATAGGSILALSAPPLAAYDVLRVPVYAMCGDIVSVFVGTLGLLLWHHEQIEQQLAQTAMTDALTGVLNRYGLMARLEQELARAERTGRPVSVMLCDLDHFKRVNDRHGHATGDSVLQDFAQRACRLIRSHDVFGRWGGEEFLLILPETTLEQAGMAAERLRRSQAKVRDGLPTVTLSAGVVSVPHPGWGYCSAAELLASADHLLYVAKETRDRVVSLASLEAAATLQAAQAPPPGRDRHRSGAASIPPLSR